MRKTIIAGNWKMHMTIPEAISLVEGIAEKCSDADNVEIIVAPPYTALYAVHQKIADTKIKLSSQNIFWEEKGAFTGEISPLMLTDAGCSHCIIGHSERRQYFGETDETVNKRLKAAYSHNLIPILCIGETLEEREAEKTFEVIEKQLNGALNDIDKETFANTIIAYEPVWAIGTGKTATPDQAQEVHSFIREKIEKKYGGEVSENTSILYGGSVKPENISGLMAEADIDGALVGGASLKVDSFASIVKFKKEGN
ncbi:MAG: triose-phosphate isomerase [Candidatus Schekmanbacteria bacterium]|nr:MAG: triose-phosphate isomerase [Candidatus Schekmanbacteria bacterium]